jgi:CRP-like cAMP-binding protein
VRTRPQVDARRQDADDRLSDVAAHATALRTVAPRRTFYREGEAADDFAFLQSGWAFRFRLLPDGRRQILSIVLPGDAIVPHVLWTGRLSCSVQSLSELTVRLVERRKLIERMAADSALVHVLCRAMAREIARFEVRLTDLGQRTAIERVACLILGLHGRLDRRGMVKGDSFPFPLRHQHIADALGITPAHVSRVFGELRAMNLVACAGDAISILDRARLREAAGP